MTVSAVFPYNSQPSGATQTRQNVQGPSTFGQFLTDGGKDSTSGTTDTAGSDAVSKFADLMKGTPEQRMFKLFLARHHLTEDQYKALSTDDQKKLADEFEQELKKKTQQTTQGAASLNIQV